MTQCESVLQHLKRGHTLTSMAAFHLFDITRLPDRVRDLRRKGIAVQGQMMRLQSGKRVMQYWVAT